MKRTVALTLAVILVLPMAAWSQMAGNPMEQVGKRNLFVGLEYSTKVHEYKLDTSALETTRDIAAIKVTTGLSDWLDIYLKGGAAALTLDYVKESSALSNYESNYGAGFGGGVRMQLWDFVNSETRVFLQGDGFVFNSSDSIEWNRLDGSTFTKDRDITWADLSIVLGVTKRWDYVDLTIGAGFSSVWWEFEDVEITQSGSAVSIIPLAARNSFESKDPMFGVIGVDFILPFEYRLSVQTGVTDSEQASFSVAISQGLEQR
jgi:hypothetical protein